MEDETRMLGETEQALRHYRQGLEIKQQLAKEHPDDSQAQWDLMATRLKVGLKLQDMKRYAEAVVEYRAGVAVLDRMIERKQNVDSSGKEKDLLEAKIAQCEELKKGE